MEQNNCFEKYDQRDIVVFICSNISLYVLIGEYFAIKKKKNLTEHKQLTFIKMMMAPRYRDVQNFGMRPSVLFPLLSLSGEDRARAGHRPETVVSCEIYLTAINGTRREVRGINGERYREY